MTVYYVAASLQIVENKERYNRAKEYIKLLGHTLLPDYTWASQYEMSHAILDEEDYAVMHQKELESLDKSDILISDATDKASFGVGYYTAYMLQKKKPVLLLLHEKSLGGSVISSLSSPMLTRKYYTDSNLEGMIKNYLNQFTRGSQ